MIRHYLKQALRNLRVSKILFGGSILTVFLGALSISLLFSYVYNELTMDDFHSRRNDIFLSVFQASPESQKEYLNARAHLWFNYREYAEIDKTLCINKFNKNEINFLFEKSVFSAEGILADSCFFEFFDFKLKVGNPNSILFEPDAAILSERFAREMFGDQNPIGKVFKTTGIVDKVYTVKGIAKNPPSNSSIHFDYILPRYSAGIAMTGIYFLMTKPAINKEALLKKIEDTPPRNPIYKKGKMSLISLRDVYFSGIHLGPGGVFSRSGDKDSLSILYISMVILLVISTLNFSNLQVVGINASIKNIGINKIAGARTQHIFYQKATEILLLIGLSSVLTTVGYFAVLPYFNRISGATLAPGSWMVWTLNGIIMTIITGLAMIYPAFVFSRIPVKLSLRNQLIPANKLFGRQTIVVAQFALSLFLLIASSVVVKQLKLMLEKDLGFNNRNIIRTQLIHDIPYNGHYDKKQQEQQQKNHQFVKNELESNTSILGYTQGSSPINLYKMPWAPSDGKNNFVTQNMLSVDDASYMRLFDFQLVKGRFFDSEKDNWMSNRIVINEAAMKSMGIEDISQTRLINKHIRTDHGFEIIGVVKDFNYERLSYRPRPLILMFSDRLARDFFIQFKDKSMQAGLRFIQQLNDKINPGEALQYTFLSDEIATLYQKEKRLSQIYILFTLIAFFISASGLFIIAVYDTQKRTKEIGIRKVNGAKVSEVMAMLNRDFVRWVVVAFLIATPVSWYIMSKWLENFAYKTTLNWWIFALAGMLSLGIALLTVSWQSWKAATRNPVETLRYE